MNKFQTEWLSKNPEVRREKERRKYERKMKRLHGDDYVIGQNRKLCVGRKSSISAEERRVRHNVRRVTMRAVAAGKLQKLHCEVCGHEDSEAHHPDYSSPLSVVWLCRPHHKEVHQMV